MVYVEKILPSTARKPSPGSIVVSEAASTKEGSKDASGFARGKPKKQMQWTRSETLALAQQSCTYCYGLGLRPGRAGVSTPCNCVFRAIFRACYTRFRHCTSKEKYISKVSLESNPGQQRKSVWGMKNEEYIADFCLVSKRTLSEFEHRVFRYHYLLGADWKLCCRKLNIDRGTFFHAIYRIEQKLGRTFRELEPHALFPLDEYFGGNGRREVPNNVTVFPVETEPIANAPVKKVLKFPLKQAA